MSEKQNFENWNRKENELTVLEHISDMYDILQFLNARMIDEYKSYSNRAINIFIVPKHFTFTIRTFAPIADKKIFPESVSYLKISVQKTAEVMMIIEFRKNNSIFSPTTMTSQIHHRSFC